MRQVKIGDKELGLRASPLALLYYKQEFGTDLVGDLAGFENLANALQKGDYSDFKALKFLQIAWAMNKADNRENKRSFPDFESWLDDLGYIDFGDPDFLMEVIEEAIDGFFRGTKGNIPEGVGEKEESQSGQDGSGTD